MHRPVRTRFRPGTRPVRAEGRRRHWGLRIATAVSVLVLAAAGIGHALVSGLAGRIERVDPFSGLAGRPHDRAGNGMNILVVGVDDRGRLSAAQRSRYRLGGDACDCTDTLMLVHLSQDRHRVSVVSLPRDSYVRLPGRSGATGTTGTTHPAKLNSAYAEGGPRLTVRTVERMTHVHVDHYVEVNFAAFLRTVDVLGGVRVCTPRPLHDDYSGLDLPAGTAVLRGRQALAYVRARHVDGTSDLGRMQRQQRFLASLIDEATRGDVLTNPAKLDRLASTALSSVRADRGFGTGDMLALARAARGLTASAGEFVTVPVADVDYEVPGIGSAVRWDRPAAGKVFTALRRDRPLAHQESHGGDHRAPHGGGPSAGGEGAACPRTSG